MKSVLFIHRSVGQNLLDDGNLAQALQNAGRTAGIELEFKEINNNYNHTVPSIDTKPEDYLRYFEKQAMPEDLVVIKSCYPNNAIKSDADLSRLKQTYSQLVTAFVTHSTGKLLIMTTPPLRPSRTNKAEARRARELASWLEEQSFGDKVSVFNFYDLLAEASGATEANMLKKAYRRLFPWDNHPNKKASAYIAPLLAKAAISHLDAR